MARHHGVLASLEAKHRLGAGLNRGAAISAGNFLLFLNNDMRFDPEFGVSLVGSLIRDDKIFATDGIQ